MLGADIVEHCEVGETLAFQHVADGTGSRCNGGNRVLGLDGDAHPQT